MKIAGRSALPWILVAVLAAALVVALVRRSPSAAHPAAADHAAKPATPGARKILYWVDPMVPGYKSDKPGKSPFMDMDLVPVYEDEISAGAAVVIDPVVVQNMGVRTEVVTEGPLRMEVRAVGILEEAEPNQNDVNLRVSGWIERLTGVRVFEFRNYTIV